MSRELGIALGLTNLLLRQMVRKGWVRLRRMESNRVRYLITPAGIAARARATRTYLKGTLELYTDTRERIRERLDVLSAEWRPEVVAAGVAVPAGSDYAALSSAPVPADKRIVFYGAGELAEIAYVSLQATDLNLVGVVDEGEAKRFFGYHVHPVSRLTADSLDGQPFERVVVMSLTHREKIRARLRKIGVPDGRVFWL
jgi:hypothetical protein